MKAIVIGAAGHIGTYLVPMLVKAGWDTTAITRTMREPYAWDDAWNGAERMLLDRANDAAFLDKLAAMRPDVIVDLVNFDVCDTRRMAEAFSDTSLSQYLFCSSCWAHGRAETLPVNAAERAEEPLCAYGRDKLASERYLQAAYAERGFPSTCIRPGQISGPGWAIIGPWGNASLTPFRRIAAGEEILLPNFGMETIHHVHGYDVAQCFFQAMTHREQALGEVFEAASGGSITLYGYARLLYDFFGREPRIGFLPWKEWCAYEGDAEECESTYLHIARSGFYSLEKERELLMYLPKYTNVETIRIAVQSYVERGLLGR